MTDTAKKPTDDSKEVLTEAELDQVAGGRVGYAVVKAHKQPETVIHPGAAVAPKDPHGAGV